MDCFARQFGWFDSVWNHRRLEVVFGLIAACAVLLVAWDRDYWQLGILNTLVLTLYTIGAPLSTSKSPERFTYWHSFLVVFQFVVLWFWLRPTIGIAHWVFVSGDNPHWFSIWVDESALGFSVAITCIATCRLFFGLAGPLYARMIVGFCSLSAALAVVFLAERHHAGEKLLLWLSRLIA